jgi:hypothetical protein
MSTTPRSFLRGALLSAAAAVALGCADAAPPLAPGDDLAPAFSNGRPTFVVFPLDLAFVDDGMCAFPVDVGIAAVLRIKSQYQPRTGLLREMEILQQFTVTLTANGRSASSRNAGVNIIDYDAAGNPTTATVLGLSAAFTVPGHGVVLLDAGRIVFDGGLAGAPVLERGPHQMFGRQPDRTAICAYLAG